MTILQPEHAQTLIQTPAYREFLDAGVQDEKDYMQRLYHQRLRYAESVAMMVYHGLVWLMETYPEIRSVKPTWEPVIDKDDRSTIVRFRLEMDVQESGQPLATEYGYDECPPEISKTAGEDAYNQMIYLGEQVGPEIWNEFICYTVADPKTDPYTSAAQVETAMQSDMAEFLAEAQQWVLENATPEVPANSAKAPRL